MDVCMSHSCYCEMRCFIWKSRSSVTPFAVISGTATPTTRPPFQCLAVGCICEGCPAGYKCSECNTFETNQPFPRFKKCCIPDFNYPSHFPEFKEHFCNKSLPTCRPLDN